MTNDDPRPDIVSAVEQILLDLLIEGGYLAAKNRNSRQAVLDAHESWMVDIRIQREEEEEERRGSL